MKVWCVAGKLQGKCWQSTHSVVRYEDVLRAWVGVKSGSYQKKVGSSAYKSALRYWLRWMLFKITITINGPRLPLKELNSAPSKSADQSFYYSIFILWCTESNAFERQTKKPPTVGSVSSIIHPEYHELLKNAGVTRYWPRERKKWPETLGAALNWVFRHINKSLNILYLWFTV